MPDAPVLQRFSDSLACVAVAPFAASGIYLGVLSLASIVPQKKVVKGRRQTSFIFVVPAHNEALSISATVRSLKDLDYPCELVRCVVVADNCQDETAVVARQAGAEVIERTNFAERGKGYALNMAFESLLKSANNETAFVVVDADTVVSPNLLDAFDSRLQAGETVLQASYRVSNSEATWRTQLMSIAFASIHDVRSLAREHFGLSTGLRGNGMCFSAESLRRVPHLSASLVEDVEHGIALAKAGIRVGFVGEAWVKAEMPERAEEAESQRQRWELGRRRVRKQQLGPLVKGAIVGRDKVLADLAIDITVPPLVKVALPIAGGLGAGLGWRAISGRWPFFGLVAGAGSFGLAIHVAAGWRASETGLQGLSAMLQVPRYVAWKLGIEIKSWRKSKKVLGIPDGSAEEWVRTKRNSEVSPSSFNTRSRK